jgi:hypothetical protein
MLGILYIRVMCNVQFHKFGVYSLAVLSMQKGHMC